MSKSTPFILGVVLAAVMFVGFVVTVFIPAAILRGDQKSALQHRKDYPEITASCITLAHNITNNSEPLKSSDPRVPAILRSLSPQYIDVQTNLVTLEFHGGADQFGYEVRQLEGDRRLWTISFYTRRGLRLLTTITNN